ncbi:MAG TPA: ElyC/SanA/YdcF family protein [Verrucomicrobiae bacterium]|nr:ElyC/SanA/YdcF family protein [Verrucomicrobiae bacterium]
MTQYFYGILVRKERWGLSWRGRLVAGAIVLMVGGLFLVGIHPFLAVTHRENTRILVVEGWVDQYGINAAVKEFETGHYERIFVTGGPVTGGGGYINDFMTDASVGADLLIKAGIPARYVQMVPSHVWNRNRTYYSAVALRDWFSGHDMQVQSMNVLTEEAHARRTWLLFQEAFGPGIRVGIISIPNPDYDESHWWRYSDGVRDVISEAVAYIYAKFFFWPPKP